MICYHIYDLKWNYIGKLWSGDTPLQNIQKDGDYVEIKKFTGPLFYVNGRGEELSATNIKPLHCYMKRMEHKKVSNG